MRFQDLTGKTFGRLTVQILHGRNRHMHYMWLCNCICGKTTITSTGDLNAGKSKSCGCVTAEQTIARNTSHNKSRTPAYVSWKAMKTRCYNKNLKQFPDYGGRGIIVCDRWLNSFENFLSDMGPRPKGYSLDRIDHNGSYEPGNCQWATRVMQNRNTRQNHLIQTQWGLITIAEAVEKSGISKSTIKKRIKNNIPESDLLKPVR